ncbi:laminin subunit alpha-3-like [Homalodisca vitripennis]|uniref:laminin subunit alpha-3-like n=1 Tax=Homalodisca vitripennis TaxID=197043 RepID=UPI001EEC6A5B|nr:laminin subunit alpha-3-like [Homalodisca vitripennis]
MEGNQPHTGTLSHAAQHFAYAQCSTNISGGLKNDPTSKVSREMLLVTLQNLQHILIRASDSVDFTRAILQDVTLDKAVLTPAGSLPRAHGIEQCECPPQYNATSCQGLRQRILPLTTTSHGPTSSDQRYRRVQAVPVQQPFGHLRH